MQVKTYMDIDKYLQDNLPFLEQQEATNNLLIGIPRALSKLDTLENPPNLFSVFDHGKVVFSCVQTPPRNFLIAGKENLSKEILAVLIPFLSKKKIKTSGVIGPKNLTFSFVEAWKQHTGQAWKVNFEQLVYKLDQIKTVPSASGNIRKASHEDRPIVEQWFVRFAKDAMNHSDEAEAKAIAKSKIDNGTLYLWEDEVIVSMAAVARPTRNGITVNYVYTPPQYRGNGYASSCVASMSQLMLEQYKFCCLFTDLSNPTSNRIYQKMGYYPIAEYREIRFL